MIIVETQAFSPTNDRLCLSDLRELCDHARQVLCPQKRQSPAGLTGVPRRKYVEEFAAFPDTALTNFTHLTAVVVDLSHKPVCQGHVSRDQNVTRC